MVADRPLGEKKSARGKGGSETVIPCDSRDKRYLGKEGTAGDVTGREKQVTFGGVDWGREIGKTGKDGAAWVEDSAQTRGVWAWKVKKRGHEKKGPASEKRTGTEGRRGERRTPIRKREKETAVKTGKNRPQNSFSKNYSNRFAVFLKDLQFAFGVETSQKGGKRGEGK